MSFLGHFLAKISYNCLKLKICVRRIFMFSLGQLRSIERQLRQLGQLRQLRSIERFRTQKDGTVILLPLWRQEHRSRAMLKRGILWDNLFPLHTAQFRKVKKRPKKSISLNSNSERGRFSYWHSTWFRHLERLKLCEYLGCKQAWIQSREWWLLIID